jgi:hypothetical protein
VSTEDIALSRLGFELAKPTAAQAADAARIQSGIDAAMRDVITRDARSNPNRLEPPAKVQVVGATEVVDAQSLVRGSGWAEPKPLVPPPGQEAIEKLTKWLLPHEPKNSDAGDDGGV